MSFVTATNLEAGIAKWNSFELWPKDFHNAFYTEMAEITILGLTENSWQIIVNHLSKWKANRPHTKKTTFENGLIELNAINQLLTMNSQSISNLTWLEVEPLFDICHSIKNVKSPVFGSKLCHFIYLKIYPVIDRTAIGINYNNYNEYWQYVKTNWIESNEKRRCKRMLKNKIAELAEQVYSKFPWETKIPELCLIGLNQN